MQIHLQLRKIQIIWTLFTSYTIDPSHNKYRNGYKSKLSFGAEKLHITLESKIHKVSLDLMQLGVLYWFIEAPCDTW